MFTYKIHYVAEKLPEEDIHALFLLRPIHQLKEYEGLIHQRHVDALIKILKNTVGTLNALLTQEPIIPNLSGLWIEQQTFHRLLEKIIPELDELAIDIRPKKKINQDVISVLEHLKDSASINPVQIMKTLVQFDVPGVRQIEFNSDQLHVNLESLLDLDYPIERVPNTYKSVLLGMITEHGHASTTLNIALNQEINLFIKKIEWLFYALNDNQQYQTAYHDDVIHALLIDKKIGYQDFCSRINRHLSQARTSQFVLFRSGVKKHHALMPVKYILDLFSKHQIHVLYPLKNDFENLLGQLVMTGDADGLAQLLSSPILEMIKIDIYAQNEDGQDCIDLLNDYRDKFPRLNQQYSRCEALLFNYQQRPDTKKSFSCVIS